jgi:hypothetical protein
MEGVWKGKGWTQTEKGKQEFMETETVSRKLNGNALLLEAFGTGLQDSNSIVNNALGVLSYNEAAKKYSLRVFMSDGSFNEADVTLPDPSTMEWRLKYDGGHLKYIIVVKGKTWIENGYHSSDGLNWTRFFEMELTKSN